MPRTIPTSLPPPQAAVYHAEKLLLADEERAYHRLVLSVPCTEHSWAEYKAKTMRLAEEKKEKERASGYLVSNACLDHRDACQNEEAHCEPPDLRHLNIKDRDRGGDELRCVQRSGPLQADFSVPSQAEASNSLFASTLPPKPTAREGLSSHKRGQIPRPVGCPKLLGGSTSYGRPIRSESGAGRWIGYGMGLHHDAKPLCANGTRLRMKLLTSARPPCTDGAVHVSSYADGRPKACVRPPPIPNPQASWHCGQPVSHQSAVSLLPNGSPGVTIAFGRTRDSEDAQPEISVPIRMVSRYRALWVFIRETPCPGSVPLSKKAFRSTSRYSDLWSTQLRDGCGRVPGTDEVVKGHQKYHACYNVPSAAGRRCPDPSLAAPGSSPVPQDVYGSLVRGLHEDLRTRSSVC